MSFRSGLSGHTISFMADGVGTSRGHDVAIAGGGPAGAIAAILLARAGLRVAVVDAGTGARRIEGASPRLVAALRAQDLPTDGICAPAARRVDWGGLTGTRNVEHAVLRPAFDRALRAAAQDEGVAVVAATIWRAGPGLIETTDGRVLRAGLVVEARGRRAPVARGRRRGPATVTIGGWLAGQGSGARVAAGRTGWSWTVASPWGVWAQASLDAAVRRCDLGDRFAGLTGRPLPPGPLLRASELRLSAPELDPALPRIGDAAVAMDPLSGHGLFWALASALHSLPLVRALLDGEIRLAASSYRARVVETFHRQARIGRDFYRAAGQDGPFWAVRSVWPDDLPAEAAPRAPHLRRQVVVKAGRLAWADALVTPQDPGGVVFLCGREVAPLLARTGRGRLPDRRAFAAALPEIPPAEAGFIHDWLIERGITTANLPKHMEVTE